MTKCWSYTRAQDAFMDSLFQASDASNVFERQRIIYKAAQDLRDNVPSDLLPQVIKWSQEAVSEFYDIRIEAASDGFTIAFSPEFDLKLWESRMSYLDGEESDEAKLNRKASTQAKFFNERFSDGSTTAGSAMLYFQRDAKQKLLAAFMVDRERGKLVLEEDITGNVKRLKQNLLNDIVDYLKELGYTENQLGLTELYDESGEYIGTLDTTEPLYDIIKTRLSLGTTFSADFLESQYEKFKTDKNEKSEKFIKAYNAKLLLEKFDSITTMLLSSVIEPGSRFYDTLHNEKYKTNFHRDTNMGGNAYGDDVANIADIISYATQELIKTSKMYSWKSSEPIEDTYLSFSAFTYIVTKVKKLVRHPLAKKVVFDLKFFKQNTNTLSEETMRSLDTLKQLKESQELTETDVTLEDVMAFISDNPQRHLQTIFDLLCNTNILNQNFGFNTYDKNLVWTLGKEIFGHWSENSRSLYDLHQATDNDRIFEIITQAVDSMFAEEFLQYYEDAEGMLKMRFLQDYSVSMLKNQLMYEMQQAHGLYNPDKFNDFVKEHLINIKYTEPRAVYPGSQESKSWTVDYKKPDGTKGVTKALIEFVDNINIPIGNLAEFNYSRVEGLINPTQNINYELLWKSKVFKDFIKDSIGIDFTKNVELSNAFEENFKLNIGGKTEINYQDLVLDLMKLSSNVIYSQAFNNIVVPKALEAGKRGKNIQDITGELKFVQEKTKRDVQLLRDIQFQGKSVPKINQETGTVEILSVKDKDAYIHNIAMAVASTRGILSAAQVKTGEGTALASQSLSCLRSSHAYQILTQNKNKDSATRHNNYVNNENGFFTGIIKEREFKSDLATKVNTDMSSAELFTGAFLGGFVGAFVPQYDSTTINRNGNAYVTAAVYSDKTTKDLLSLQLNAESKNQPGKYFINMSDTELEYEMKCEFGKMYDSIVNNINKENLHLAQLLGINTDAIQFDSNSISIYRDSLQEISERLCDYDTALNLYEQKLRKQLDENPSNQEASERLGILTKTRENVDSYTAFQKLKDIKAIRKDLAKIRKNRSIEQLHHIMADYNRSHRRKPIEMCEQIHYLFDDDGFMVPNNTLIALWGRFNGDLETNKSLGITDLYPANHQEASTVEGYFKYEKDLRMVQELLTDGVEIFLRGSLARSEQPEIKYLLENYSDWVTDSGKMAFAKIFKPTTRYNVGDVFVRGNDSVKILQVLHTADGNFYVVEQNLSGKGITTVTLPESSADKTISQEGVVYYPVDVTEREGNWEIVQDPTVIKQYADSPNTRDLIKIHPMLSKMNRLSYLAAQQYTSSVGGAHYVYKGKKGASVLEEEANRWLASNKRNVCYASTVHKYQNKTLNGVPKWYQIAPIEDISSKIYSIMGDLGSHKPLDGGMIVNPWFPILENNSLGGEAAGLDKKQFGTYYYERYAAGGIIKTAGFAITNQRMRSSIPYRNLCQNITDRVWIKEFTNDKGEDIEEYIDITRDYKGNVLNWVQDANGAGTFYQKETSEGGCGRYKLARIDTIYTNGEEERIFTGQVPQGWRPTNRYKIFEYPVTSTGEIDTSHPEISKQIPDPDDHSPEAETLRNTPIQPLQRLDGADENGEYKINTNWTLFNKVFGGYWALSLNQYGKLEPSENSIYQMVHAINNIGYTRTIDNNDPAFGKNAYTVKSITNIKDPDDLWQPLKYSDISYAPNIGALKSTQMNVNPKEALYEHRYLNAMNIMTAQLGIQLDKEHHADDSEVSMPTQIIQACANKGYTIYYSSQLYNSLAIITEIAIQDCMKGIMEIMPGNTNTGKLLTEVSRIIVDRLVHSQDDASALSAVMDHLVQKAKQGVRIESKDVIGQVAWSDPSTYNKIYSDLASHLSSNAIKMKFPGTLAVICPTEKLEQMYGNKRLGQFANPDKNLSERTAQVLEQELIRNTEGKQLIYNIESQQDLSVQEKENLVSNIDTQHNYWIEWIDENGDIVKDKDGNIFRENITIDEPSKYYKLKEWISVGSSKGKVKVDEELIPRKGWKVARCYENIMDGRELGAYNARFESEEVSEAGTPSKFCIFDLDSIKTLFDYNDLEVNYNNAVDLINDDKFILPQRDKAYDLIIRLLAKKYPNCYDHLEISLRALYPGITNKVVAHYLQDPNKVALENIIDKNLESNLKKDFAEATFKVCKVLTYKAMEQDLFKISKDYEGERKLWANGRYITVNPNTIQTQAYELIMPKVYQTRFGLESQDQVQEILENEDFFTERAIERIKRQNVPEDYFHFELKNFNGQHIYIYDSRQGQPDPTIFTDKNAHITQNSDGTWERRDSANGEFINKMASGDDKIMRIGNLGYEVIVTDNPEFYLENLKYNIGVFSNKTVSQEYLQEVVNKLQGTKSKEAKKFLKNISFKDGNLKKFNNLKKRNTAIKELSLESKPGELPEITRLVDHLILEGKELHSSFNKSLDIIAGRIPAQSQQSFMPQRVVAFDNNDINTAYVSTFQLFLQGSKII